MVDRVAKQLLIRGMDLTVTKGGKPIIDRVNLTVNAGEIVTLVGPNGAGKSTLIRVLLRLTECDTGRIERKPGLTVGYVPQFLEIDQTFPLNVRRFLLLGAPESKNKIEVALEEVGVATVLNTPMQGLSGGEMRRVLLARALLRDPELLVLDEPTAGVDISGQAELYEIVRKIRDRRHCGVLLVSHNLHLVMAATDHVLCLNRHICCEGKPENVARDPSYLTLFGSEAAASAIAVFNHQHDHQHDLRGATVDLTKEHTHG